jgi:hypothetical protein
MLRTPLSLIKRSQELFLPDSRDQAGTLGEKLALAEVERVIDNLSGMARVYRSIRIPKSQHLGKFEIDLLVVTEEAVLVLEVKHWSGRLRCKRGQWEQERNGERKPLQDPLILNQEKRQAIDQWLATRGIKVPSQLWFAGLVLTHPHVRLETDLSNHPHVWLLSQVRSEIMKLCAPPKRVWWHLRSKGSVPRRTSRPGRSGSVRHSNQTNGPHSSSGRRLSSYPHAKKSIFGAVFCSVHPHQRLGWSHTPRPCRC